LKSYTRQKAEESHTQALDGRKKVIKFFGSYVIEVRQAESERQSDTLQIYDFESFAPKVLSLHRSQHSILFIEVERQAIFILVKDNSGKYAVYQLTEMENNQKIENLLKSKMFYEASRIARAADFPEDVVAEICKRRGLSLREAGV
jgi:hypothetical protein